MKGLFTILAAIIMVADLSGQAPAAFKYQAVVRDASGNVQANKNMNFEIALLQSSIDGPEVFSESHNVTTNEFGLVNLEIGSVNTEGFSKIEWAKGPFFITVTLDGTEMGTSQLLSVPYAIHSNTADHALSGDYNTLENKPSNLDEEETDDVKIEGDQTIAGNKTFTGTTTVPAPVHATDAANKAYVDSVLKAFGIVLPDNYSGTVSDIEGNVYKTVTIGTQVWFAENLRTGTLNDGNFIPIVTESAPWSNLTTAACCWYDNDMKYNVPYGALYNWYTVITGSLCPAGWHVPADEEWTALTQYLGDSVAGVKLKETGTTHWISPNAGATNETGFTALPGGQRFNDGGFHNFSIWGTWWSTSELDTLNAWSRTLSHSYSGVIPYGHNKRHGFSVRCVKD